MRPSSSDLRTIYDAYKNWKKKVDLSNPQSDIVAAFVDIKDEFKNKCKNKCKFELRKQGPILNTPEDTHNTEVTGGTGHINTPNHEEETSVDQTVETYHILLSEHTDITQYQD